MLDDYVVYGADTARVDDGACSGGLPPPADIAELTVREATEGTQIVAVAAVPDDGTVCVAFTPGSTVAAAAGPGYSAGTALATVYVADADDVAWESVGGDGTAGAFVACGAAAPDAGRALLRHGAVWRADLLLRGAVAVGRPWDVACAGVGAAAAAACYPARPATAGAATADYSASDDLEWSGLFDRPGSASVPPRSPRAPAGDVTVTADAGGPAITLKITGLGSRTRAAVWVSLRRPFTAVQISPVVVPHGGADAEPAAAAFESSTCVFPWAKEGKASPNTVELSAPLEVPHEGRGCGEEVAWDLSSAHALASQVEWTVELEELLGAALERGEGAPGGQGTPLHAACLNELLKGDPRTVRYLLTAPPPGTCPVDARDAHGRTALHHAVRVHPRASTHEYSRVQELVACLLSRGKASVHAVDNEGSTPLHLAAMWDTAMCDVVKTLLAHGAAPSVNKLGFSPLQAAYACEQFHNAHALEEWQLKIRDETDAQPVSEGHIRDHNLREAFREYDTATPGWVDAVDFALLRTRFVTQLGVGVGELTVDKTVANDKLFVDGLISFDAFRLVMAKIPRRK